jgi:hypothetical protein
MRLGLAAAFSLALVLAPDARADERPPLESEAERLIAEGVELRKEGKEREAFERFDRAYALEATPRALAQMGLAAKSLRRFVEAEDFLARALQVETDAWIQENRAALALALEVVKKNLAWLDVKADVEAELFVDGSSVGTLPLEKPLRVRAGAIRIDLRAEGFTDWSKTETLVGGGTGTVIATLTKLPKVVSKSADSSPKLDRTPLESRSEVDGSRRILTWTALGVGASGIVVGTIFGVRTLSLKNQRDEECPTTECRSQRGVELDEDARTAAMWSTIGFAVGAAGLATATVLYLTEPAPRGRSSRRSLTLAVSPVGAIAAAAF